MRAYNIPVTVNSFIIGVLNEELCTDPECVYAMLGGHTVPQHDLIRQKSKQYQEELKNKTTISESDLFPIDVEMIMEVGHLQREQAVSLLVRHRGVYMDALCEIIDNLVTEC